MKRLLLLLAALELSLAAGPPARGGDLVAARNDQIVRLRNYVLDAIGPSGLVRDSLVLNGPDFHPATPDAAGFALVSLAALDHVNQLDNAGDRVEAILNAYAGNTPGVTPDRSADGHFLHWMDMQTGARAGGGWPVEYTPIGSALLVAGAQFAANHFTDRPAIRDLARELTTSVDFDAAIHPTLDGRIYLTMAEAGGGGPGTVRPWNEYMLVASLALKQPNNDRAKAVLDHWLTVDNLPKRNFLGIETLTDNPDHWAPAFWVQQMHFFNGDFRHQEAFETFFDNHRQADARYSEIILNEAFRYGLTAGVSPQGYHADRLANHPNEVFSPEAVAAWGDMETFLQFYDSQFPTADPRYQYGLVRESDAQPNWVPNDAGLVDHLFLLFGLIESIDADFFAERVFAPYIPGDFDDNGKVGGTDFLEWQRGHSSDYDANDLAAWQANYGSPWSAAATAVPEPKVAILAAIAGVVLLLRGKY